MPTFALYTDAALTQLLAGNLVATQNADGSTPPVVFTLYLGSPTANRKIQANANPGVDPIQATVVDANTGSGHSASEVKLAATQAGLAAAVGGSALDLGTEILSGAANAKPIWIEVNDATHAVGTATELAVVIANVRETATA
ncbi:hypothetical protein [Methylococcus capsulatus]|jgi:hypothetical protein|uniref:Uncharacterized protein n=1 Tax=Methylococcus capsulatus TaxID=414 RepID=A0AA35V085_METCP|nr:hypothetical protein [Methylococcus capsulatus]QXP89549.1 hypothetical protein KW114_10580 [Methylococcus capsulatus]CAI8818298.1 conserved protein of unknown function [Methylococcus capsulatus]